MEALLIVLVISCVIFAILYFHARAEIDAAARRQYDRWRTADRDEIITQEREIAQREARARFEVEIATWRMERETAVRQDAISRSKAVIVGRVTEHVAPWLPVFPYNPKDARFIGSPVDMLVFEGADDDDVRRIIFLEIKSGSASLTRRQRQIRDVIDRGKVEWQELKVPVDNSEPVAAPLPAALPQPAERLSEAVTTTDTKPSPGGMNAKDREGIRDRLRNLDNRRLIAILTVESGGYTAEAIALAEAELAARGTSNGEFAEFERFRASIAREIGPGPALEL